MAIYYLCPDSDVPCGGVKQIYRHVDILHRGGMEARVLHWQSGFRCSWFEHATPTAYLNGGAAGRVLSSVGLHLPFSEEKISLHLDRPLFERSVRRGVTKKRLESEDVVVVPEVYAYSLAGKITGLRKVIFNQGAYCTFKGCSLDSPLEKSVYFEEQTLGVITVSDDSLAFIKFAFPKMKVLRVCNGIDTSLFSYSPIKQRQIAFMPRRLPEDLLGVVSLLKLRGVLSGWSLAPIDNMTERQVAAVLAQSLIFLSTAHREGWSLPLAEAASCGCVVIGYHGMGGREFLKPEFAYPIAPEHIVDYATTVEAVIRQYHRDPASLLERGRQFSEFIGQNYSLEREEQSVLAAWKALLHPSTLSPDQN